MSYTKIRITQNITRGFIMKKILPVALIGLATITSVYASENSKKYNTINYTTQAETSIKSDSILDKLQAMQLQTFKIRLKLSKN